MGKKDNKYYLLADKEKVGRPLKIKDPKKFLELYEDYLQYLSENPIITEKITTSDKGVFRNKETHPRPPKKEQFARFCGFYLWESINRYKAYSNDFCEVVTCIENQIIDEKFDGASVGIFNASIIARDLGLRDGQDHTTNGKEMQASPVKITFK